MQQVIEIDQDKYTELYLNLYTFKRSTILQSSVIAILCRHKGDHYEDSYINKMFMALDTNQDGFLSLEELKHGFEKEEMKPTQEKFRRVLGKTQDIKLEWEKVFKCIDTDGDG